jgi:hypothetical protein
VECKQAPQVSVLHLPSFVAILLVIFGLTATQAPEEFIELNSSVLEGQRIHARARTAALEEYITILATKHGIDKNALLADSNK